MTNTTFDAFSVLLEPLESVWQEPEFHPEGLALFHSLQVYEHASSESDDPELLAAALLHDVGKAQFNDDHAAVGAELLDGLVSPRVTWLVEHHLDLLREPKKSRALLAGSPWLDDLERLREWDLAGRSPHAWVPSLDQVLGGLLQPGVAEHWLTVDAVRKDGL